MLPVAPTLGVMVLALVRTGSASVPMLPRRDQRHHVALQQTRYCTRDADTSGGCDVARGGHAAADINVLSEEVSVVGPNTQWPTQVDRVVVCIAIDNNRSGEVIRSSCTRSNTQHIVAIKHVDGER